MLCDKLAAAINYFVTTALSALKSTLFTVASMLVPAEPFIS